MQLRKYITQYDEKLWKDFERFVIETYQGKYSFYGKEIEKALRYHLATMGFEDYPTNVVFPGEHGTTPESDIEHTHKLRGHVKTLLDWILGQEEGSVMEFDTICNFLRTKCGLVDNRTYKKYVTILLDLSVLKDVGRRRFEAFQIRERYYYPSLCPMEDVL